MAAKSFPFPLIQIRGCKSISDALEMFPFDYVCKFCLINDIKWSIGTSYRYPQISDMINLCHILYKSIKDRLNEKYCYNEDKGFRVTVSNKQIELSYELKIK